MIFFVPIYLQRWDDCRIANVQRLQALLLEHLRADLFPKPNQGFWKVREQRLFAMNFV